MGTILFMGILCAPVVRGMAQSTPPYPKSTYITNASFSNLTLHRDVVGNHYASGDQWGITWADDGHLYTGWGDGTGFGYRAGWRDRWTVYMGLARIQGSVPNFAGLNVWGGYKPESQNRALYHNKDPEAVNLKPANGLIFLNGKMYWYVSKKGGGSKDCLLWSSTDYGKTWVDHGPIFQENGKFCYTTVMQFGKNYTGVPAALGDYLYIYDGGTESRSNPHHDRTDMILARVPMDKLTQRSAYEFFNGTPASPSWTSSINKAKPVFHDDKGVNWLVNSVYNKWLGRYILVTKHSYGQDTIDSKGFGIFEAKQPWGPWRTIYYTDRVADAIPGVDRAISFTLTQKWMSNSGKNMWMVFSGRPSSPMYSYNLIEVKLDVVATEAQKVTFPNAIAVSPSEVLKSSNKMCTH